MGDRGKAVVGEQEKPRSLGSARDDNSMEGIVVNTRLLNYAITGLLSYCYYSITGSITRLLNYAIIDLAAA